MLIPTFRFFIVPASAVVVLLALAANQAVPSLSHIEKTARHAVTASQQTEAVCIDGGSRPQRSCATPAS